MANPRGMRVEMERACRFKDAEAHLLNSNIAAAIHTSLLNGTGRYGAGETRENQIRETGTLKTSMTPCRSVVTGIL